MYSAFFQAVETAAAGTPVVYPNIESDNDGAHYRVYILPAARVPLGVSTLNRQPGVCQVSCYVRDGIGEIEAVTMADRILETFPRGTKLEYGTDGIIRIDAPGWISSGVSVSGWYYVPVSIPYIILTD